MKFKLLAILVFGLATTFGNVFAANCLNLGTGVTVVTGSNSCNGAGFNSWVSGDVQVLSGGVVSSTGSTGLYANTGIVGTLTNAGTIETTRTTGSPYAIQLNYAATLLRNQAGGVISSVGTANSQGVVINDNLGAIENSGTIQATTNAIDNGNGGTTNTITNLSGGSITGNIAIRNFGSIIQTIDNAGSMSAVGGGAIYNYYGTIGTITNTGTMTSSVGDGIYNNAGSGATQSINEITNNVTGQITGANAGIHNTYATIGTITNYGAITGGLVGIYNDLNGVITRLNNAQNGLTYAGTLPSYYNIIITNTGYGTLNGTGQSSGSTVFGVSPLSTLRVGTFQGVLTGGFSPSAGIANPGASTGTVTGTISTYSWTLTYDVANTEWDLTLASLAPPGPSTADTQVSLQNTATALKSTYALQNSVIANSLNYDCQVFDKNNVCVSAGGRNTNVQAGGVNNVSALLIAAYRAMPEVRVGAYLDQNLSVTSSSSPVVLGNGGPLFGLFGVWNQNPDGSETEVKVSASFGQKNTTTTRAVVGTSEAGVGSATLNNSGVQAIAKYGFAVTRDAMVSPYIGLRYSQGNMGGYTEATSATVTTPLTYAALNTNATTFMAGVHGKYKLTPEAVVQASVGLESDTNVNNGSLTATGITGLTAINFNPNPVKTRPVAMLGGYYDVAKAQRVALTGIYRQEPYQAIGSTTVLATYTVGF